MIQIGHKLKGKDIQHVYMYRCYDDILKLILTLFDHFVYRPIAVALYEYDTLGDESNLAFDEGDVIEVCFNSVYYNLLTRGGYLPLVDLD